MNTSVPEIEFPKDLFEKVIIAMKGHPSTGKSDIALLIGEWARSHVLYIDDFLQTLSLEKGYTAESMPSTEEADRLLRLALEGLYAAAERHLVESQRVVIKSRFCSTLELDLLIRLINVNLSPTTIIIESRMKNEYRWRSKLETNSNWRAKKWYKATSWEDVEKAKEDDDDDDDSQASDFHLLSSLKFDDQGYPSRVRRLVLDYFDDPLSTGDLYLRELTPDFKDVIKYLLSTNHEEATSYKARYVAHLQFNELNRYLLEDEISKSKERRKYLCSSSNCRAGSCVFKFWEELPAGDRDDEGICHKACEEGVASGKACYRCHFCFLTLHKSCAEIMPDLNFLNYLRADDQLYERALLSHQSCYSNVWNMSFCKSCKELGKSCCLGCESCYYELHLKSALLPTIINHDCHELHFLSIHFAEGRNSIRCKACAEMHSYSPVHYVCHLCKFVYHSTCAFLPREVKQEHGGHEHVLKLMYSHRGMDQEDDHWCNACYDDIDPQNWFYSCQDCPYYLTHASANCVGSDRVEEAVRNGNLPIRRTDLGQILAKVECGAYSYISKDEAGDGDNGEDKEDEDEDEDEDDYGSDEVGGGGKGEDEDEDDDYSSDEVGDGGKGGDEDEDDYGSDEMDDGGKGARGYFGQIV